MAVLLPNWSVPALTIVSPEYVLADDPPRHKRPVPSFVMPTEPAIMQSISAQSVEAPFTVMLPPEPVIVIVPAVLACTMRSNPELSKVIELTEVTDPTLICPDE